MTGWKWLAAGIALALGLAGILWAVRAPQPPDDGRRRLAERAERGASDAQNATPEQEIAALREALAVEREARIALAREVEELRAREPETPDPAGIEVAPAPAADPGLPPDLEPEASPSGNRLFDERKLEMQGIAPGEVARLRERFEEAQMQGLYLRDQAAREGWLRTPRFRMTRAEQQRALREELGDESYDLMLFASGQPNRVRLAHVLEPSPARAAGLEAGDRVLRYDGERIFSASDLQLATRTAKLGSQVAVDVLRDDEEIRVYLPPGPIGAQLEADTLVPER
jgi:hypothetical protein